LSEAPLREAPARLATAALASAVLGPLLAWHPGVLDDARLDGGVLGLLALVPLVLATLRGPGPAWVPGTGAFLAGLALALVPLAGRPVAEVVGGLADRAPLLSAWALVAAAAALRPNPRRLLAPLLWGAAAVSAVAFLVRFVADPFGWLPYPEAPPVAPWTAVPHVGEFVTPLLVAWAALLAREGNRPASAAGARRGAALPATLLAFHAGFLGSLAAIVSLAVGLGWVALRRPEARRAAAGIGLAFLLGLGAARLAPSVEAPSTPGLETPALPPSLAIRVALAEAAARKVAATPLGIGLGRFEADYPTWRSREEARLTSNDWRDRNYRTPKTVHDDPLQLLLEAGWFGGALLLAAFLVAWRRAAPWFTAPALAFGVHVVVRAPILDDPPALALLAVLLGAALAGAPRPLGTHGRRATVVAWGLALFGALPGPSQVVGEVEVARALRPGVDSAGLLARATRARPWDPRAWEIRALGYMAAGRWDAARRCLTAALTRSPNGVAAWTAMAQLEMSDPAGDPLAALAALRRAEALAAHHPAVRDARRRWLSAHLDALEEGAAERAAAGDPSASDWLLLARLVEAWLAVVEDHPDEARSALYQAAAFGGPARARLERLATREGLDEETMEAVVRTLYPDWPRGVERR